MNKSVILNGFLIVSFSSSLVVAFYYFFNLSTQSAYLESKIREDFADHLVPLDPPPFQEIMGRTPQDGHIALGRMLFNDTILSRNNDVSCATCHLSNHGFADGNPLVVGALGIGGPTGDTVGAKWGEGELSLSRTHGDDGMGFYLSENMFRNALSTVNIGYRMRKDNIDGFFHDGRFGNLFFMVLLPIHTSIEMCGTNPVPLHDNPFVEGGALFGDEGVELTHVNTFDYFEGRELGSFNAGSTVIRGVPTFRPNGVQAIPGRNECLAIAIAKIRSVPEYRKLFEQAFGTDEVTDRRIGIALASFIMTHVSKDTPFDRFVAGKSSLSDEQMRGLVSYFTPIGRTYKYKDKEIKGAGCFKCHNAPLFGGEGFASLGVRSDSRSSLSRPEVSSRLGEAFFDRQRLQRGVHPNCHIENVTISPSGYAPDIGRAGATFKTQDCFKVRVPPLRNVIETFPYFHHGTASAQGFQSDDFKERSLEALRQVIGYHLRGPIDHRIYSRGRRSSKVFFDELHQLDYFIPFNRFNFVSLDPEDPQHQKVSELFPVELSEREIEDLLSFVAYGLFDPLSVVRGALGNDVSHPKRVPSGLTPSITRDHGHQLEITGE